MLLDEMINLFRKTSPLSIDVLYSLTAAENSLTFDYFFGSAFKENDTSYRNYF